MQIWYLVQCLIILQCITPSTSFSYKCPLFHSIVCFPTLDFILEGRNIPREQLGHWCIFAVPDLFKNEYPFTQRTCYRLVLSGRWYVTC